jgi:MFS family permease
MTALALNVSSRILTAFFGSVRGLPRTYWFLWAGTLANRVGSLVMPMMAIYLTKHRGLTVADAGAVVSLYGAGSFFAMQLGGWLADRIGRRTTMLVSLCLSACSMLSLGFAPTTPLLMGAGFSLGLTGDIYRPASQAVLADVVPAEDRVRAFGLLYWAINLGFSIAAVVGGQLAEWSFTGLFIVDAATTLAFAGLIYKTIPETKPQAAPGAAGTAAQGNLLTPFLDKTFGPYLFVHLFVTLVFFQFQVALPADMQSKGMSPSDVGFAMAVNGVLIVALQPIVIRRIAGSSRARVLALAAVCIGLGFGANAWALNMVQFMFTVSIWTLGEILMAPVNASIVADLSPTQMRGRYQGAFGLVWSVGVALGPLLSGTIISHSNTRTLWFACIGIGLLAAVGHLLLGPARLKRLQELGLKPVHD